MNAVRLVAAVAVALFLAGTLFVAPLDANPLLVKIFGPPATEAREAYAHDPGLATVSHEAFDRVLAAHVRDGLVDYEGLAADRSDLDRYVEQLAVAPFDELDRDGKLALLMNAYNAFTLVLILDHQPLESIRDIPAAQRWQAKRWTIGGRVLSLDEIEHQELREKFVEPRVHFAINCASIGCPPLRDEAFVAERVEEQLAEATRALHADPRWLRVDPESGEVHLTKLYAWYAGDFSRAAGTPLGYAARYRPELAKGPWKVRWLDYDWRLNQPTASAR